MEDTKPQDIYAYITAEEQAYNQPIPIAEGYEWSMKEHITLSTLYKNSIYKTGKDDDKPFKNITRPLLNLQYRAEDIDLKDVVLYVDDPDKYHLSFLVKKYHDDVFAVEHDLDTFFDEIKESKIDYGGGLALKGSDGMPETRPLQSLAFADQTDLLNGPLAFKDYYSPSQLEEMADAHWGDEAHGATISLDDLIELAQNQKSLDPTKTRSVKTTGKYVEVYMVMGSLPKRFYESEEGKEPPKGYMKQFQIVAFYRDDKGERQGVTLFKSKKPPEMKLLSRDKIYGRGLGLGGAEELFEPQVWTNYDTIRMKDMLDAAAKTILITSDPALAAKHPGGLKDLDNLELLEEAPEGKTRQLDTFPRNITLFEKSVAEWEVHAQQMSGATDALLGESPTSGTPFKLQDLIVQQGKGIHDYRRGKNAKFFQQIYTDWILPQIAKKLADGSEWLSELDNDDLQYVVDCVIRNESNRFKKEKMLKGELPNEEETNLYEQVVRDEFMRKGNKHFMKVLKGELKDISLKVKVNIAGKQDDVAQMVDKLSNIIRFAFSTYNQNTGTFGVFEDKRMAKLFSEIVEYSGLSPIDFAAPSQPSPAMQQQLDAKAQEAKAKTQEQQSPIQLQPQPLAGNQ